MYNVARERLSKGRHVLIENPWNSAIWDYTQSQKLFQEFVHDKATLEPMECVKIDQRMLGLVDSVNGLPRMKPTGILTASGEVKRRLHAAQCDGNHYHQQLDPKARCVNAQQWPRNMCDQILSGLLAELDHILTLLHFLPKPSRGWSAARKPTWTAS